jgi:acyl carrier protein
MSTQYPVTAELAVECVRHVLASRIGADVAAQVTERTRLADVDIDSLDSAEIIVLLEMRIGVELDAEPLAEDMETVGDLAMIPAVDPARSW